MISGVFARAPGGGRPDHRLEAVGAGQGVWGSRHCSVYLSALYLSTRRSSRKAESRRLVEEVRREPSLTAGMGWPQALRQRGMGGGHCQPACCGLNVCPQATGRKPDTQCDGLRRRGLWDAQARGSTVQMGPEKALGRPDEGTRRSLHPEDDGHQDLTTSGTELSLQPPELQEVSLLFTWTAVSCCCSLNELRHSPYRAEGDTS